MIRTYRLMKVWKIIVHRIYGNHIFLSDFYTHPVNMILKCFCYFHACHSIQSKVVINFMGDIILSDKFFLPKIIIFRFRFLSFMAAESPAGPVPITAMSYLIHLLRIHRAYTLCTHFNLLINLACKLCSKCFTILLLSSSVFSLFMIAL